jgi:hypothetical protein
VFELRGAVDRGRQSASFFGIRANSKRAVWGHAVTSCSVLKGRRCPQRESYGNTMQGAACGGLQVMCYNIQSYVACYAACKMLRIVVPVKTRATSVRGQLLKQCGCIEDTYHIDCHGRSSFDFA